MKSNPHELSVIFIGEKPPELIHERHKYDAARIVERGLGQKKAYITATKFEYQDTNGEGFTHLRT